VKTFAVTVKCRTAIQALFAYFKKSLKIPKG
jgi:hypothetical protein